MKKTLKQRNMEFLQSRGWTEDMTTRVSRYTVMSKPGEDYHYYLGRAGAVRRGRIVSSSISVRLKIDDAYVKAAQNTIVHDTKELGSVSQTCQRCGNKTTGLREGGVDYCTSCGGVLTS